MDVCQSFSKAQNIHDGQVTESRTVRCISTFAVICPDQSFVRTAKKFRLLISPILAKNTIAIFVIGNGYVGAVTWSKMVAWIVSTPCNERGFCPIMRQR